MGNFNSQEQQKILNEKDTIVIVGGGPVGLWMAIQLKLMVKKLNIIVFEKRKSYVREHVLIVRKDALETSQIKNCPDFDEMKSILHGKVPTKLLEQKLNEYATNLGVKIIIGQEIKSIDDVIPHVASKSQILAVLGADGRRSSVRNNLMTHLNFNDKQYPFQKLILPGVFLHEVIHRDWAYKALQVSFLTKSMNKISIQDQQKYAEIDDSQNMIKEHVFLNQIMIKYAVKNKGQAMEKLDYYKTLLLMDYPVTEVVGKQQPGQDITQMTAVFIVPDEVADQFKHFTPWEPGHFKDLTNLDAKLKHSVDVWFNAKKELLNQEVVPESERINYVPISVYSSTNFVEQKDGIVYALAGDSAFGVPYFRALNNGLDLATQLCEQIGKLYTEELSSSNNIEHNFQEYSKIMRDRIYEEYTRAHKTTFKYNSKMWFVKVSGQVPWQVIKFMDGDFKKRLQDDFDPSADKQEEIKLNPEDYHPELKQQAEEYEKTEQELNQQNLNLQKQISDQYSQLEKE